MKKCVMGREREQTEQCKHTQRASEVKVPSVNQSFSHRVSQSVSQTVRHLYQDQRPWGASSCFHHFPDVGLERGGEGRDGGGGGGQRGGCRAKDGDDDNNNNNGSCRLARHTFLANIPQITVSALCSTSS